MKHNPTFTPSEAGSLAIDLLSGLQPDAFRRAIIDGDPEVVARETEWRSMDWLPSYEISANGAIRRTVATNNAPAGKILRCRVSGFGYVRVSLCCNGKQRPWSVHRLVCEAWHGKPFEGAHAAHCDGNALNNHYGNLRWKTCKENARDRRLHGTQCRGETTGSAVLTDEIVRLIRVSRRCSSELAELLGVSTTAVERARNGTTWSHVV